MNSNDYGRKVSGTYKERDSFPTFEGARFIGWGTSIFETYENAIAVTKAIIELPTGQVITTFPECVKFDPKKWEE